MRYYRPSDDRGKASFGWLNSRHSFSFGGYYDPNHMGFSALRVINDDSVAPGAGFDTHGHSNMEIISYVLEGAIEHKDSMGNSYLVPAGDVQRMSAGTGVTHSEFNHSQEDGLHFLQIWITPNEKDGEPGYEQKTVAQVGAVTPLITPDGREGSLTMRQDASMFRVQLAPGERVDLDATARPGYLHVIEGAAEVDELPLAAGDGLGLYEEAIALEATEDGGGITALWFDLPAPRAA